MGIFAPTAWNLAGSSRKSLISSSSSTASLAPATSANVVFGMSLLTALALVLPKFMMREPPPCIWFMKKKSRSSTSATGISDSRMDIRMLSCGA
ncbi:unannotated protein [freshwater metagenome]|uniref:Unannotated protein n=1 Tax=freshwater metagenome TaxID=449393 RepID=A0A6J7KYB1_9ZZZZ